MRRLLKYGIIALCLYGISQFCNQQTDGFALTKISTLLLEERSPPLDNMLLHQRYHYLTKGGQSYVFVSEDGHYILKFFRSSKLATLQLLHKVLPLHAIKEKIKCQEQLLKKTLKSYLIAKTHLQKETGLLDFHYGATSNELKKLVIIDKLKIQHTIDPNLYPFVIQERAQLVKEHINQLMQNKDRKGALEALSNLFYLIEGRLRLGIDDTDPNFSKNFGFIGNRPIEIDAGRLSYQSAPSLEKIADSKEDMQHWLNKYHKELSEDFHNAYLRMIQNYETL